MNIWLYTIFFYFHGAYQGRKYETLSKDTKAVFETDRKHQLNKSNPASNFLLVYENIIGNGHVSIIEEIYKEKRMLICDNGTLWRLKKRTSRVMLMCMYMNYSGSFC